MEQREFSVVSKNTVNRLSLHDCRCAVLAWEAGKLVLEMDWMEVLSEHPDNPYPEARQSGPGRIELIEPVLVSGLLYPSFADEHPETVSSLRSVRFQALEILTFAEEAAESGFQTEIFALFDRASPYDSVKMEVAYAESRVMWNTLGGISWFEEPRRKK